MNEKQSKNIKSAIGIIAITLLVTLLMMYLVCAFYFINHFYWGTTIDEVAVGGKSVKMANAILQEKVANYTLTIKERSDEMEVINGQEIQVVDEFLDQIQALKKKQNAFSWPFKIWEDTAYTLEKSYEYDEKALKACIHILKCMNLKSQQKPTNATVVYENGTYIIKEGELGNQIKTGIFVEKLKQSIERGVEEIDLDENECYVAQQYTKDSKEIIALQQTLNDYLKASITYQIGSQTKTTTADEMKEWLEIDEVNLKVFINDTALTNYVTNLADTYNTVGDMRSFKTSNGNQIQISGGDYGWKIDETAECAKLKENLEGKQPVKRSPIYSQEGVSYNNLNDIGTTYVEIDLSGQYLWLYKNNIVVTEGSIVSGTADGVHTTPAGVYKIDYKQRYATLRGPGYTCPVAFWMPFNGGIGIHDATWRGSFGGSIYLYNGSHGCINCPYWLVEEIYNEIEVGTPVVCYY